MISQACCQPGTLLPWGVAGVSSASSSRRQLRMNTSVPACPRQTSLPHACGAVTGATCPPLRRLSTRAPLPSTSCWALTRPSCLHGRSEVCGDSGVGEGRWLPAPPRATAAVHQAPAPDGCVRRIFAAVAHRGTDCPHACATAHVCTRPDPGREDRPQQRHAVLRRLLGAGVGLQDCRRHAVPCYPAACPQRCHMHACGFALRCAALRCAAHVARRGANAPCPCAQSTRTTQAPTQRACSSTRGGGATEARAGPRCTKPRETSGSPVCAR